MCHLIIHHFVLIVCPAHLADNVAIDQPDFDEMEEDGLLASNGNGEGISKLRMGELVKKYLQAQTLEVLKEDELEDAVTRYVDKDDPDAIKE